ncbi:hypothetical protein ACFPOC_02125 [Rubellimicrobium aerolatum]|uniref:Tyr recombinase domain-containing protein n=2 Tax=Rubellimicrobium aerolatum TaxID=490979 RepID=A0ABW0S8K0_9RHOB
MLLTLGLIHSNPFSVCTWSDGDEKKLRQNEESRARTVWDDRLLDLYRTPVFQGHTEEPGDPLFWAPLIARHQGGHMEEILQLGPDDFGTDRGIPYMRVRNLDGNHVKSESSERFLPLHPNLVELGLMHLVELCKRQGQRRLFPNLGRGATKGTFTELFTKAFGYYRKANDVYWLGLDFHAFRTTFHADLMNSHCSDAIRRRLMGHAPLDEGETSYAQGLSVEALQVGIGTVKVDISRIRSPFADTKPSAARARAGELGLRLVG